VHDAAKVVVLPTEGVVQRVVARLLGSPAFWVLFVVVGFGWPIVRVARTALPPPLPILGNVNEFALVDQSGHDFGARDVRGRVWVLATIETGSPSAEKLATELGKIQHRGRNLGPAFHIVTVGSDPRLDTRESLAEFTSHHRVSPRIWSFLSGDTTTLRAASAHGVTLPVTLVDQKMRVRGQYDLADKGAADLLLYHVGLLVNRGD
jgi:cytochrome oxidase Cu insertion factor (SCO1/SenC/PrrC family)